MNDAVLKLDKAYNFLDTCLHAVRGNREEETACIGDVLIAAMNYVTEAKEIIQGAA